MLLAISIRMYNPDLQKYDSSLLFADSEEIVFQKKSM